jgi:hypothetical protein
VRSIPLGGRSFLNFFSSKQVVVGLATSVILLVLAVGLAGRSGANISAVDSVGILQLIWLLRGNSGIQERIAQVEQPSVHNLRAAGMFPVRMTGERLFGEDSTIY